MNKLIIHLGPPKTATTSLQHFLQEQNFSNIEYLGIKQPRGKSGHSFTSKLYEKVIGVDTELNLSELKQLIKEKNVILSEEMLLVQNSKISWKDKLRNLKDILNDFEVTIVIVAREPISAIKSYYQELYYSINKEDFPSINHFALSEYCEIYDYKKLTGELYKIGFHDFKILDYDKLISGHYTLNNFEINNDSVIKLGHKNRSFKKSNVHYAKNPTLRRNILNKIPKSFKNPFPLSYKQKLSKLVPNIKLKRGKIVDVDISSEINLEFNSSYDTFRKSVNLIE